MKSILMSYRKANNLTSHQMAERLGINHSTYQSYELLQTETGKRIEKILQEVGTVHTRSVYAHRANRAAEVRAGIEDYLAEHPGAKWEEVFQNVESHYSSANTMKSCFNRGN